MGFDVAAIGLADLFGFGELADVGAGVAADIGLEGAADVGLGAAAEGGADLAAGAGAAGAGGAEAAELGAADALAVGGVDLAGELGGGAGGALEGAGGGLATDTAAGVAANAGTVGSTAALPGAGTIDAGTELAGSQNIDAALGVESAQPVGVESGASTASAVQAANPGIGGASAMGPGIGGATAIGEQVPAAAAVSAGEAGGGVGTTLSSIGDSASSLLGNKAVQLGLPLGVLGYDLIKGPGPIPSNAQSAIANAQAGAQNVPLFNQTAATDLNLANNFQISPAQAASIETWKNNQYNQLYQQIANQGVTDPHSSSEWVQGKNQIDQQALSQQVQMVNQLVTTAFQAAGASNAATSQLDATLMQAAQIQMQQDAAFQQSVSAALQAFGLIAALSGKFGGSGATA